MEHKPFRPVRRASRPAPTVAGHYKIAAGDFEVEEIPAYEPAGEGPHTWLWVEKRGIGTLPLIDRLAAAIGCSARDLGYAGLKDAHAVTRQWISVPGLEAEAARRLEVEDARVLDVRRHGNKLKVGHLRGNRFTILLGGTTSADVAAVRENLTHLAQHGVPNYFGEQRFGKRGANVENGLAILAGDPRRVARRVPKRLFKLLLSAVQSDVFNRVVAARIDGLDRLVAGDVAWLHANGACFAVESPRSEQPRCDRLEISPSGPLPGPKMMRASGEVAAAEERSMAEVGLTVDAFGAVPGGSGMGARRSLRARLTAPDVDVDGGAVRIRFELEKGAFATSVLRELLDSCPWFGG